MKLETVDTVLERLGRCDKLINAWAWLNYYEGDPSYKNEKAKLIKELKFFSCDPRVGLDLHDLVRDYVTRRMDIEKMYCIDLTNGLTRKELDDADALLDEIHDLIGKIKIEVNRRFDLY